MTQRNEETTITCVHCNSDNVVKSKKPSSIVGVILLLIGIPLPIFKKEYHCFDCDNDFKIENAS